jgi:DNA-binding response OmpR family regulator
MKITELPKPVYEALAENLDMSQYNGLTIKTPAFPVKLSELIAEIRSTSQIINLGKYSLDSSRKILGNHKKEISLTEKEAAILSALANSQAPLTKDDLLAKVWGYSKDADTNTLETHIYRLRQKILDNFGEELIVTENSKYTL